MSAGAGAVRLRAYRGEGADRIRKLETGARARKKKKENSEKKEKKKNGTPPLENNNRGSSGRGLYRVYRAP